MNRRERLERCYACKEVDRPAVYSRTGFPQNDTSYDPLRAYLQAHTELKLSWSGARTSTDTTESRTEPVSESFQRQVTTLHTPRGELYSTRLVSLRGQPGLQETYFLKTREDAEKYLSLPLPAITGVDVPSFEKARDRVGDAGIVSVPLGRSPGGYAAELFGTEGFAMMTLTDRDIIHELCRREMRITMNRVKTLIEHGIGPFYSIAGEEYIVPPIHGPADFHDFIVQFEKPIFDLVHEAGGYVHVHCHGSIKRVFQGFLEMGVDALHPFEAPPMGDITPLEAKQCSRGKICLEGNIQIHRMYEASPDEVRQETEELIRHTFDDHRGLIVCPTASPYIRGAGEVCFPQYRAMIDAVLDYRG